MTPEILLGIMSGIISWLVVLSITVLFAKEDEKNEH
jgi:hypothetical protein